MYRTFVFAAAFAALVTSARGQNNVLPYEVYNLGPDPLDEAVKACDRQSSHTPVAGVPGLEKDFQSTCETVYADKASKERDADLYAVEIYMKFRRPPRPNGVR